MLSNYDWFAELETSLKVFIFIGNEKKMKKMKKISKENWLSFSKNDWRLVSYSPYLKRKHGSEDFPRLDIYTSSYSVFDKNIPIKLEFWTKNVTKKGFSETLVCCGLMALDDIMDHFDELKLQRELSSPMQKQHSRSKKEKNQLNEIKSF